MASVPEHIIMAQPTTRACQKQPREFRWMAYPMDTDDGIEKWMMKIPTLTDYAKPYADEPSAKSCADDDPLELPANSQFLTAKYPRNTKNIIAPEKRHTNRQPCKLPERFELPTPEASGETNVWVAASLKRKAADDETARYKTAKEERSKFLGTWNSPIDLTGEDDDEIWKTSRPSDNSTDTSAAPVFYWH